MNTKYDVKNKHIVVDKEWIKERIEEKGLFMIDSTFTNLRDGFFAFTIEGYIIKVTPNTIYKNQTNPIFSNKNPYVIYNIKRFLFLNNISSILLSTEYMNNKTNLRWKCKCGNEFEAPWNRFFQGQRVCSKCSRREKNLIPIKKIKLDFHNRGYELVTETPKLKKEKVEYICSKHKDKGIQEISLSKFYDRKQGCKYCGIEKNMQNHIISKEECMNITSSKGLNYIESYVKDGRTMIDFTCENHKDKEIQSFSITQMRNTKFGCKYCNMSKYINEEKIDSLLKSWNILFKRQHSFQKCRDKNALPFDFYIPEYNTTIEYQGEQHYKTIQRGSMTREDAISNLEIIQKHDEIKRKFCIENNINHIEIPYWKNNDIDNFIFDAFIKIGIIEEVKSA